MTAEQTKISPPPRLMAMLLAGFDTAASHLGLILFPIALDVWLWLGPHLRIETLILDTLREVAPPVRNPADANAELWQAAQSMWQELAPRFNLFTAVRSFPVGVPSLMAARLPVATPWGQAPGTELEHWLGVGVAWSGLMLVGVLLGSLYFLLTAGAAAGETWSGRILLHRWLHAAAQVFFLTILWMAVVGVSAVPVGVFSMLMATASGIGLVILLFLGGLLMWIVIPLLFAPHGIFVYRQSVFQSIRSGVRLVRMTMPTTSLFFLAVFVISRGLDVLWNIPPDTSWFVLVGIFGHAFITTALLAASFIYYREAGQWIQKMLEYVQQVNAA